MALTYPTIYKRVKDTLGRINGLEPREIYADMNLADAPLMYDERGLRALAPKLNRAFSDQGLNLTSNETSGFKTVRDAARLVYEKIG